METETEMEMQTEYDQASGSSNKLPDSVPLNLSIATRVAVTLGVEVDTVWKLIWEGRIQININKDSVVEYISIGAI